MRKNLIISCLLISFCLSSFSQTEKQIADLQQKMYSLKRILPELKGIAKVDGLNNIVDIYQILDDEDQMQVDSATPYAKLSINEAKKIGYKRGLGYAYLKMSYCEILKADLHGPEPGVIESIESQINQAIGISDVLNDNVMIGSAYWLISRLNAVNNKNEQRINSILKSITYFKQPLPKKINGTYNGLDYVLCDGCVKNEFMVAQLYMELIFVLKGSSSANEYVNLAISHYKKAGANSELGNVYMRLARLLGVGNDAPVALDYFKKAADFFHESHNEQDELWATTMICASYYAMGDFENGLVYIKRSVQLVEKLSAENPNSKTKNAEFGNAYYWMARIYSAAGDHETALSLMRKAHDYYPDKPGPINSWASAIGEMYRLKGDYDSAMHYLVRFANFSGTHLGKLYLGRLYISIGQYDKALPLIDEMIKADTRNTNMGNLGGDYTDAGKIWLGKKDYQKALSNARTGLTLITKTKRNQRLMDSYQVLSEIFSKLGKNDSAYFYLKQSTQIKDSFLTRQFFIRLNDYKKQAEEERKTSQINLLNKDNQLQEQALKQEATVKKSLIAGLVLLSLLAVFIFRTLTLKRKSELVKQQLENDKKQAELQQKATELEMQALRAQMNPHFIFNCLSSINKFILKNDTDAASDYLTRFSRLIRFGLTNSQLSLIPLNDEIEMLRLYLDMERLRFSETFDYNIIYENTIEPETIYIPPMLLQPFCENAIWHGLMHKQGQGKLEVMLSIRDNQLQCIITDNGIGREKAAELKTKSGAKQKSFGLKITTERLALFNNEKAVDAFYNTEDMQDDEGNVAGTKVILKISHKNSVEETSLRSLR